MSYRSPFVNVIGSPSNLEALVFFCGPVHSVPCSCFNCVEVVLGSTPSIVSSIPCPMVRSSPLSSYVVVAPAAATFSEALVYSAVTFAASEEALTSSANYSFRFYCASNLATSFYLCIIVSSCAAKSGAHHLGGHEASTVKTMSSIVMNGRLI